MDRKGDDLNDRRTRSGAKDPRSVRRDRVKAISVLAVVVLVPLLVIFIGPLTLKAYDAAHQTSVTCTVTSAHSGIASSHSLKGVGTSSSQVVFESSNCGTLVLRWGVTPANEDRLASTVESGQRYEFQIGAGSYNLRGLLQAMRQAVFVKEFRKAS